MEDRRTLEQKKESLFEEIRSLKQQLYETLKKRQAVFEKRGPLLDEFKSLTAQLRTIKRDLDQTTEIKKLLKQKRAEFSDERRHLLEEFRRKCREEEDAKKKLNIRSLHAIQLTVKQIETQIETQGLPFDKEKKLTERLKQLRRKLTAAAEIGKISDEIQQLKRKIDAAATGASTQHDHLYERIATDHQEFSQLRELASKVNALRPQLDAATDEFIRAKESTSQLKELLNQKSAALKDVISTLQNISRAETVSRKEAEARLIDQKTKSVEEKIRARKKLTTQDIIILQGAASDREKSSGSTSEAQQAQDNSFQQKS